MTIIRVIHWVGGLICAAMLCSSSGARMLLLEFCNGKKKKLKKRERSKEYVGETVGRKKTYHCTHIDEQK